jgi:parallel beta-helix repeat protein
MRPISVIVALFVLLAGLSFSANITSCTIINTPGVYDLTQDISGAIQLTGFPAGQLGCIQIRNESVTIDCHGHSITNSVPSLSYSGIVMAQSSTYGAKEPTIRNCVITGYQNGIYAFQGENASITNNTLFNNFNGIYLNGAYNATVWNNTAYNNSYGIRAFSDTMNNVRYNNLSNNSYYGAYLYQSDNMTFFSNTVRSNGAMGMYIDFSTIFKLYNNTIAENGQFPYCYGAPNCGGFDLVVDPTWTSNCGDYVLNNTGSGGRPILYANGPVTWQNQVVSEAILCGASYANVTNVTVRGSDSFKNNAFFIQLTDHSLIKSSNSSNNYHGFYTIGTVPIVYNTTIRDCVADNDTVDAFFLSGSWFQLVNNTATKSEFGFRLTGKYNTLSQNNASRNQKSNMYLTSGENFTFINNTASFSKTGTGINITVNCNNAKLINNTANSNSRYGFHVASSSTLLMEDNSARNNTYDFSIQYMNHVNLTGNAAFDSRSHGFYLYQNRFANLSENLANHSASRGFYAVNTAYANPEYIFTNNTAQHGGSGYQLDSANFAVLYGNTAFNNTADGFYYRSDGTVNSRNNATMNRRGFYVSGTNNSFANDTASDNLWFDLYPDAPTKPANCANTVINMTSSGARPVLFANSPVDWSGIDASEVILCNSDGSNLSAITVNGSDIRDNNALLIWHSDAVNVSSASSTGNYYGIYIRNSSGASFDSPLLSNNLYQGFLLEYAASADISSPYFSGNTPDFDINGPSNLNLTSAIFDSPSGGMSNFTNLTIGDTIGSERYRISWDAPSPGAPFPSFKGAFVNITRLAGTVSIDNIGWRWLDSELGGGDNEAWFRLYYRSGGSWTLLNNSPDTSGNSIALHSLALASPPGRSYGILQDDGSQCPVPITSPGSYSLTNNVTGAPNPASPLAGFACVKIASSNVVFDCNGFTITNDGTPANTFGVMLNGSLTNITIKNCPNISQYTFGAYSYTSTNAAILNSTMFNNTRGILFYSSNNHTIANCTSINNLLNGIYMQSCSNIRVANNSIGDNLEDGIRILGASVNNSFENNQIYDNAGSGIYLSQASSVAITNNAVSGSNYGIRIYSATDAYLADNTVSGAQTYGVSIQNYDGTVEVLRDHYFNNSADFFFTASTPMNLRLGTVIFDNPAGNFTSFTNLSLNDSLPSAQGYQISWASNSTPIPQNLISFDNKFIDIKAEGGSPAIDSVTWHWTEDEVVPPYDEAYFGIWDNSTGWAKLPAALDTLGNTLSIANLTPAGQYGILQVWGELCNASMLMPPNGFNASQNGVFTVTSTVACCGPHECSGNTATLDPKAPPPKKSLMVFSLLSILGGDNYTAYNITTQPITNAATNANLDDDDFLEVLLPFTFNFYDGNYSSAYLESNGWVGFGTGGVYWTGWDDPYRGIFFYDDDLQPSYGGGCGNVLYDNSTYPDRVIFQWDGVCEYDSAIEHSGEIIIHDDNSIEIYNDYHDDIDPSVGQGVNDGAGSTTRTPPGTSDYLFNRLYPATPGSCSESWNFSCGSEPDGDNTWDSCSSYGDESDEDISDVYISSTSVQGGALMSVTCAFRGVYDGDYGYAWYYNGADWRQVGYWDWNGTGYSGDHDDNLTAVFTVDDIGGTHWVRCGIVWDTPDTDECADTDTDYHDNDDVNFTVTSSGPLQLNSVWVTPDPALPGISATCSANVTSTETAVSSVSFNITQPDMSILELGNGTQGGDVWDSAQFVTDQTGSYTCTVLAQDNESNEKLSSYSFTVSPKGVIPMGSGTPFYTTSQNPTGLGCLQNISVGQYCNTSWIVNATGPINSTWEFFVIYGDTLETNRANVTIVEGGAPPADIAPPVVTLNYPANASNLANATVPFSFTAVDNVSEVMDCLLYLDGAPNQTNSSTQNDTLTTLTVAGIADGPHYWQVICDDNSSNTGYSESRNFTLNTSAPASHEDTDKPSQDPLSISLRSTCDGNMVSVTSRGYPVSGAEVKVDGDIVGTSGQDGEVEFEHACGDRIIIRASRSGYISKTLKASTVLCSECAQEPEPEPQPQPEPEPEPECAAPSCCTSDSQCADIEYCSNRDTGAEKGKCVPVTGCGLIAGHAIAQPYQCSDQAGCACPEGRTCRGHFCVSRDINGTKEAFIGSEGRFHATEGNWSCAFCEIQVTDPAGKSLAGKTDANGDFVLPLTVEGTYKVALLQDGEVVKTLNIQALPKAPPSEPEKPTQTSDEWWPLWLIILLALIIIILLYWRRKKKKPKK